MLGYQELVVEGAKAAGLAEYDEDLGRITEAAHRLNAFLDKLVDGLVETLDEDQAAFEARLRHDLRTPLNAVIGYSEMILEELDAKDHPTFVSDIKAVLAEAGTLLSRIGDIADLKHPTETLNPSAALSASATAVALGLATAVDTRPGQSMSEAGRILVVDDVASNRDLLARRLVREGHDVLLASSGQEALNLLDEQALDVLLVDILMPDMNGIELLARLRANPRHARLPVIMVSGLREIEAVARCIEAGADDYLTKPFDPVLLRARLSAALEKKRWLDRERAYLTQIETEKARADTLLHAILPGQVVARLNRGEQVIADRFEAVTVLFADLVGFTSVAAKITPQRLVRSLHAIFEAFDGLAGKHGVEKIKTIGDSYMAAAGLPEPVPDHADRILALGRDMLTWLAAREAEEMTFRVRIGVHTGPVVAGLLGSHRFVYDMWGETVNVASRLEAHGVPDQIQISRETLEALISDVPAEPRGAIELKGIGFMDTWLVDGTGAQELTQ